MFWIGLYYFQHPFGAVLPCIHDQTRLREHRQGVTRLIALLLGVLLLALLTLTGVWLAGQLLSGLGAFVVAAAGVLAGLLRFLLLAGVLCGVVYFVTSSWRSRA